MRDKRVTDIVQLLNRKPDAKYPRMEKNVQVAKNGNIPGLAPNCPVLPMRLLP